jgi:hypothetical protein
MWVIGALLLVSFALFVFGRIAETQRMSSVFFWLGMAVWALALFAVKNESAPLAIVGFAMFFISDFIARPILRRRLIPPRVRVKDRSTRGVTKILCSSMAFCLIAFFIFQVVTGSIHSIGSIFDMGLISVLIVIGLFPILFQRIEVCGNGLWKDGSLQPWEDYRYFAWEWKMEDIVELRHGSTTWRGKPRLLRIMVAPEDRETVQQLLEVNLPDLIPVRD